MLSDMTSLNGASELGNEGRHRGRCWCRTTQQLRGLNLIQVQRKLWIRSSFLSQSLIYGVESVSESGMRVMGQPAWSKGVWSSPLA